MADRDEGERFEKVARLYRDARGIGLTYSAAVITLCSALLAWTLPRVTPALGSGYRWVLVGGFCVSLFGGIFLAIRFQYRLFHGYKDEASAELHLATYDAIAGEDDDPLVPGDTVTCGQLRSQEWREYQTSWKKAQSSFGDADRDSKRILWCLGAGLGLLLLTFSHIGVGRL